MNFHGTVKQTLYDHIVDSGDNIRSDIHNTCLSLTLALRLILSQYGESNWYWHLIIFLNMLDSIAS